MGDFKIAQFQKKETLKLDPKDARDFYHFLIKYKGATEDKTGFKREKQIRAIRMTLNDKNRSLHMRQTRSGKKTNIYAHTEKNPRKKPIGHGLDALRNKDEHFGTGSNLVRRYYNDFKRFKKSKILKKSWIKRRKKYGKTGHK